MQLVLSPCGVPFLWKLRGLTVQGKAMDELTDGKKTQQNGNQRRSKVSLLRTGKGLHVDGDRCH